MLRRLSAAKACNTLENGCSFRAWCISANQEAVTNIFSWVYDQGYVLLLLLNRVFCTAIYRVLLRWHHTAVETLIELRHRLIFLYISCIYYDWALIWLNMKTPLHLHIWVGNVIRAAIYRSKYILRRSWLADHVVRRNTNTPLWLLVGRSERLFFL